MREFDKSILSKNIKNLMKTNGVSQPKLAEDLHVGQPSISKCINGKQSISIDLAFSIAQYFGVSLDDLCRDPDAPAVILDEPRPHRHHNHERFINTCEGLAAVFKYSSCKTKTLEIQEPVYAEDINDRGIETGHYSRRKGPLGTDPVIKYPALYFPNYHEIETQFPSPSDADEYFSELHFCGNSLDWNMRINEFFNKLADLNMIYQNGSITQEAYIHAIDSNLDKIREE